MLTQGMDALTREIVTAYAARVAALSRLRKATRTRIARLAERRQRLATRQGAKLARERSELASRVRQQLRQQHDARHALAMRQRAGLAQQRADLAQSVSASMQPLTADRVAAHEKWRSLGTAMHGRRTSATTASARKPAAGQAAPTPVAPVAPVAPGEQSGPRR